MVLILYDLTVVILVPFFAKQLDTTLIFKKKYIFTIKFKHLQHFVIFNFPVPLLACGCDDHKVHIYALQDDFKIFQVLQAIFVI